MWVLLIHLSRRILIGDLEGALHHVLGHKLDKGLLEDHFLGFFFFNIFLKVVFHGLDFFKDFSHQINVASGHLLHPGG